MRRITPELVDLMTKLDTPISDLGLCNSDYNVLYRNGIRNALDFVVMVPYLQYFRGVGEKRYYSLLHALESLGFDTSEYKWEKSYGWTTTPRLAMAYANYVKNYHSKRRDEDDH